MASNTQLNTGTGGSILATKQRSHDGDTSQVQVVTLAGVSGTEDAYTFADINGDATNGLDVDVTRVSGNVTVVQSTASNLNVTAALAAGTNNIGDVDVLTLPALPAGTNNIGDVDVLSVVPGTGATALGKAIDSAAGATDTGVALLAVRDDSLTTLTPVDGDYVPLRVNANGAQYVSIESGGITGRAEDSAHTSGHEGVVILAVRRDSASSGVDTDGDYATLSVTSDGSLRVSGSAGTTQYAEDAASAGGESLCLAGAVRQDTLASNTSLDGDYTYLKTTSAGRLYTSATVDAALPAGTNNIGDVDVLTVPTDPFGANADAASATGSISAKLRFIASTGIPITGTVTVGSHAVTNAGTFATQVDGAALTALQLIDNTIVVDDAAFTPATSSVNMAGFQADETATDSVDEGDAGAARMTLDRKIITSPQPHTSGGLSIFRSIDLDETEEEAKGTAGCVYGMWVTNTATATRFIKFYNATAANVTVGSTTPVITIGIPGNTSDDVSGNFGPGGMGITFDTAITLAATTGVADADTGAPGANDVIVNLFYK